VHHHQSSYTQDDDDGGFMGWDGKRDNNKERKPHRPTHRAVEVKDDIGRRRRLGQIHDGGSWLRGRGYS
jgi:hypothetical protein